MPLLSPPRTFIEAEISDLVLLDTIIKRKVRFEAMHHHQDADGQCRATLFVRLYCYANAAGAYGPQLEGPLFRASRRELYADNNCLVDAATGAILAVRDGRSAAEWETLPASFEQPTMLQGDFFEYLRENQPILIGELIRHHIQQADAMGRFA